MGERMRSKKKKWASEKESDVDRSANTVAEEVCNVRPLKVALNGRPIFAWLLLWGSDD